MRGHMDHVALTLHRGECERNELMIRQLASELEDRTSRIEAMIKERRYTAAALTMTALVRDASELSMRLGRVSMAKEISEAMKFEES